MHVEFDFDFKGPFEIFAPIVRKRMSISLVSVMDDLKAEAERRHRQTSAGVNTSSDDKTN